MHSVAISGHQLTSAAISGHQRDRTSPRSTGIQGELVSTMASSIGGTQSHWSTWCSPDDRRQLEDIRGVHQKGSSEPSSEGVIRKQLEVIRAVMMTCTHPLDGRMTLVARAHGVRADRTTHLARLALLATCQIERMHAQTRQSPCSRHQKPSVAISRNQSPSVAIRRKRYRREAIRGL